MIFRINASDGIHTIPAREVIELVELKDGSGDVITRSGKIFRVVDIGQFREKLSEYERGLRQAGNPDRCSVFEAIFG